MSSLQYGGLHFYDQSCKLTRISILKDIGNYYSNLFETNDIFTNGDWSKGLISNNEIFLIIIFDEKSGQWYRINIITDIFSLLPWQRVNSNKSNMADTEQ